MAKKKSVRLSVILLFMALSAFVYPAQEDDQSQIRVIAQYKERVNEKITASGNVEIHYKDIKLFADWVELDTETKNIIARGNVSIHLPGEVISVEQLNINLETSQGDLKEAHAIIKPTITYEAELVERESEDFYRFHSFSPLDYS